MTYEHDYGNTYRVTWTGDFGVIVTTAEYCTSEEQAEESSRRQLIDWHGFDPLEYGFKDCEAIEL